MATNSLFRLKVQYKRTNQTTGEIEKVKAEILAQCLNYTEAEALMIRIGDWEEFDKFEPYAYEIAKVKFTTDDLFGGEPMCKMGAEKKMNGLIEHYFANDSEGIYAVNTIVPGCKEKKTKDKKTTYYIPAKDVAQAMRRAQAILQRRGEMDGIVPSAKLDNATSIYLDSQTSEAIYRYATQIFG